MSSNNFDYKKIVLYSILSLYFIKFVSAVESTLAYEDMSITSLQKNISLNQTTQQNVYTTIGLYVIIAFISIFTVAGNIMVIMAVVIFRKLRRVNNLLVVSLASADLIMGGVVLPFGSHYVIGSKWLLGKVACDLWTSIDVLSVTASICTLCAIALDRFVAIFMPFEYSTKMTKNRARLMIGSIWIISAAIAFIPINLGLWKTDNENDIKCYNNSECCEFRPNQTYAIVSSLISFYIPLIVMIFSYSIVFKIAIEQRAKICNREGIYRRASLPGNSKALLWGRGEYRAVFTMGIIMGTFVFCWLPFFIVNIVQAFCHGCVPGGVFKVLNWLGYANSFFNPIIYCHSIEFRRAFKRLLLCGLCREGYQQTCRASLSISYSPSSNRSSLGADSLFNFFISRKNSGSRQSTRLNSSSMRPRGSPKPNGFTQDEVDGSLRRPSENGFYTYDLNINNNITSESKNQSTVSDIELDNVPKYFSRADEIITRRSYMNVMNSYQTSQQHVCSSSTHRPVSMFKEQRSMSTISKECSNLDFFKKNSSNSRIIKDIMEFTNLLNCENKSGNSSQSSVETRILNDSNEFNETKDDIEENNSDEEEVNEVRTQTNNKQQNIKKSLQN